VKPLRLYVSSNRDGLLVCPETLIPGTTIRTPDSRRRVFLAGDSDIRTLNHEQLNALIEVAFNDPKVRQGAQQAVFYDAKFWAERERHKIILRHTWT